MAYALLTEWSGEGVRSFKGGWVWYGVVGGEMIAEGYVRKWRPKNFFEASLEVFVSD
jgi:hypothetical protein